MKNILLVAYDWPPAGSVGMLRMLKFAKELARRGYGVSVLTRSGANKGSVAWDIDEPALEKITVIRIPAPERLPLRQAVMARIYSGLELGWSYAVEREIDKLLGSIEVDVVMSSSPPESAHLIAARVKELKGAFWVADMRDLWSDDHYRDFGGLKKALFSVKERSVLRDADAITTVSETWAKVLRARYGDNVSVIPNGYDQEYFDRIPVRRDGKFRISYLGKLNAAHQDIGNFLAALRELIDAGSIPTERLEADFYVTGYGKPDIDRLARSYGLEGVVREFGPVPFGKALDIMKNSSLLLIVGWKGRSSAGWRPQKVYEYMGSRSPMMIVNGEENVELKEMLTMTRNCALADSRTAARDEMLRIYRDFAAKNDSRRPVPDEKYMSEYSVSGVTDKLCRIMERR